MDVPDRTVRKRVAAPRTSGVRTAAAEGAPPPPAGGDEPSPAEKLLKYFPEAALALYITLDPMLRQTSDDPDVVRWFLFGALAVSALFCWMYLGRFWKVKSDRQKAISVGALVLYVAAIGGPFGTFDWYEPIFGAILAVVATAFLVFVKTAEEPAPA